MKTIVGILFLIIGLFGLLWLSIKEKDKITHWKIMIAASLGVLAAGGLIILVC